MTASLVSSLQSNFGFSDFRPGQLEALQGLLDGQHTLVVMPTGSGKSLVFQLAALHLPGLTLVISPLIALMKDQVDSLKRCGIPSAFINSSLTSHELSSRLKALTASQYRIVYLAPERLRSNQFLKALQGQSLSLLVVDEAHCISEWGHDFRPDYLHIAQFRSALGSPLTVALTATAAPNVQEDIIRLLALSPVRRVITGFNRPNLALEVVYVQNQVSKLQALRNQLRTHSDQASIVYTGTRRDAEEVAEFITTVVGIKARYYHAGLLPEERESIQDAFISRSLSIVAATNAFGMGIDRPDVRQVIHFSLPGSLEAYYQEAGRAGRDGGAARAVLFYSPEDRALQEWFIMNSSVSIKDLQRLYKSLRPVSDRHQTISVEGLSSLTGFQEVKLRIGLAALEQAGVLSRLGDVGIQMSIHLNPWNDADAQKAADHLKNHQISRKTRLEKMIRYAESSDCRRKIILSHFGDPSPAEAPICCDNCQNRKALPASKDERLALSEPAQTALVMLDAIHSLPYGVGKVKLVQILRGSKAQDIHQMGYDRQACYGKLVGHSNSVLLSIVDQLLALGCIKVVGGKFPVLRLTPSGEAAVRHKSEIPVKLQGSKFAGRQTPSVHRSNVGSTVEETFRLFSSGLAVQQIAAKRGLALTTIYVHASKLIADGRLSIDKVVPGDVRHLVEKAICQVGSVEILYPIKMLLPDEIDYNMIRCVVEAWKRQNTPDSIRLQKSNASTLGIKIPKRSIHSEKTIKENIIECVRLHPGKFHRSSVANLLVGSQAERIVEFHGNPYYDRLAGSDRSEILALVDQLILDGQLVKDNYGNLVAIQPELDSKMPDDPIENFLACPHPRRLPGPWDSGWALGFHSAFSGAEWSRSGPGDLTYRLKYQGDMSVIPALVDQSLAVIADHPELLRVDALIPVPPSVPRPSDPVSSFASALALRLNRPLQPVLVKSRRTDPQKELNTLAQKRLNVANAFILTQPSIRGKRLLVIDDLFDSGATLEEIYRLLHRSGAAAVHVLTLTRTIHSEK